MSLLHLRSALVACALLAFPLAGTAAADGHACQADPGRPACTILRPIYEETAPAAGVPECIVIVGGLGSLADKNDRAFFGAVLGDLDGDPRFRTILFGADAGTYRSTGEISRSGGELARVLASTRRDCGAVHVLAHSMGGVVADRALARSAPVSTYVALASPHNGANAARLVRSVVEFDPLVAAAAEAAADALEIHDPAAEAVRDLARARAPRPIRAEAVMRLRVVTDPIVLRRDHADRRVDVREYLPSAGGLEGHGAIAHHPLVQEAVRGTLRSHQAAHEPRSDDELQRVVAASIALDAAVGGAEDTIRGVTQSTARLLFPYR